MTCPMHHDRLARCMLQAGGEGGGGYHRAAWRGRWARPSASSARPLLMKSRGARSSLESFNAERERTAGLHDRRCPRGGGARTGPHEEAVIQISADCYIGQGHEIRVSVPIEEALEGRRREAEFERLYEQVYGLRIPLGDHGPSPCHHQAVSPKRAAKAMKKPAPKPRSKRTIYDPALGKQVSAPVYWRDMKAGSRVKTPPSSRRMKHSIIGANFDASINKRLHRSGAPPMSKDATRRHPRRSWNRDRGGGE